MYKNKQTPLIREMQVIWQYFEIYRWRLFIEASMTNQLGSKSYLCHNFKLRAKSSLFDSFTWFHKTIGHGSLPIKCSVNTETIFTWGL